MKRFIFCALAIWTSCWGLYAATDENNVTPTHWYKFDNNLNSSGSTSLNLDRGTPTYETSDDGQAAVLAASRYPYSSSSTTVSLGTGDFTILTAAKTANLSHGIIWAIGRNDSVYGLALVAVGANQVAVRIFGNGNNASWPSGGSDLLTVTVNDAATAYHHYTLVYTKSSNACTLYVDGLVAATATQPLSNCNGLNFQVGSLFFDGHTARGMVQGAGIRIDDFRVYQSALTSAQLAWQRPYTYYRFTFKEAYDSVQYSDRLIQLSELSLYDANGNRINQGTYTSIADNTAPASLAANQVVLSSQKTLTSGKVYYDSGEGPVNLFDGNTVTKFCTKDGTLSKILESDQTSWVTISFRVPDGTAAAASYSFTTANDYTPARNPASWTLEGSTDGTTWMTLDSQSGQGATPATTTTESDRYTITGTWSEEAEEPEEDPSLAYKIQITAQPSTTGETVSPANGGWVAVKREAVEPTKLALDGVNGGIFDSSTPGTRDYRMNAFTNVYSTSVSRESTILNVFALPAFGKKFTGWTGPTTSSSSTGALGSTTARKTTLTGNASRTTGTRTWTTLTATFTDVDQIVDIPSHVGDEVTLHFYSPTPSTWATVVDGFFISGTSPMPATYGTIKRSLDNATLTNHFSVTLKATSALSGKVGQLSVIDDAGNNYCYTLTMLPRRYTCRYESIHDVNIDLPAVSSKTWSTPTSSDPTVVTAGSIAGSVLTVTQGATGTVTVATSNYNASQTTAGCMGADCSFAVTVYDPLAINLCEGDYVKGGFRAARNQNWFMYVDGVKHEISPIGTGDVIVATGKIKVRLAAVNPTQDATLQVWAEHADDTAEGYTHISVTDGSEWYGMHVHVGSARVIQTDASVTANLASFADHAMNVYYVDGANAYVTATVDNTDPRLAATTLTGVAPTDYARVQIYEAAYTDTTGPQALGYVLAMKVEGPKTLPVMMSAGTTLELMQGLEGVTAGTAYTVEASVADSGVTATAVAVGAGRFKMTLNAAASATPGSTVRITVKVGDEDKIHYNVTVYPSMSMAVGQVAPGCLTGCVTPWTVWTSDATGLKGEPVVYGQLNSGRMEALRVGDYYSWATNSTASVGSYAIKAKIHDEANTGFCMAKGTSTNLVVECAAGLEAVWSATGGDANVTLALGNTTDAASDVTATVTAAAEANIGTYSFTVKNDYHYEYVNVFVGDESVAGKKLVWTKNQVVDIILPGVSSLESAQILPNLNFDGDWEAYSENTGIVTLSTSSGSEGGARGERDDRVWVKPVAAGSTRVIVTTSDTVYVYEVKVTYEPETTAQAVVGKGETKTVEPPAAGVTAVSVSTVDKMIVDAKIVDGKLQVTGLQDGETTVLVNSTDGHVYHVPVRVHNRTINKTINLVIGKSTSGTYTYTFDDVISVDNKTPGYVTYLEDDHTLTFTPTIPGNAHVSVVALVDGLNESTTLNYTFNITKLADTSLEVLNYGEGYITYKDAAKVQKVDDDYVLVFTNTAVNGTVNIPDELTANFDILAVGGGGAGGSAASFGTAGGGGGAGGFVLATDKKLTRGSFSVVVGAGADNYINTIDPQATPGNQGEDSVVTNAFGYALALAKGGGGGGAPSAQNTGRDGGSGGGGAFNRTVAGQGGHGESGQGANGGTPTAYVVAAGGGGAGGNGGADGTGGAGRTSSITGVETLYAGGGEGGRADAATAAAAGVNPGDGGDGGNGGAGGAGADGMVVMRLKALYKNIQVPVPTTNDLITARFLWSEGTNCAPFECVGRTFRSPTDQHPYNWEDVIDHIDGTTNIVCTLDGTNKVGVGYYNFKVYLKDGYSWVSSEDSAYGSVQGMSYRWVVVEDWANIDASIAVNKTVWWTDSSNATVRVNSISSPEMNGRKAPQVLFLGTLCGRHGIANNIIQESLACAATKADVDYFLFTNSFLVASGSLPKGGTFTQQFTLPNGGAHYSLRAFYETLYDNLVKEGHKEYDYVVLEFDGSRIANFYDGGSYGGVTFNAFEHEKDVADALKPLYEQNRVIWIVDNAEETYNGASQTEPFTPYWQPNTYHFRLGHIRMSVGQFRGLVGIFSPSNYVADATSYTQLSTLSANGLGNATTAGSTGTDTVTHYACPRNEMQAHYNDPPQVLAMLTRVLRPLPYNLSYLDKIVSPSEGLTITGVTVQACTNEVDGVVSTDPDDWVNIIKWEPTGGAAGTVTYLDTAHANGIPGASMGVNLVSNIVTAVLSNIDFQVWVRYDTQVLDDGTFCTSEGASYNQSSGQYEKNPNEGVAFIEMVDDLGRGIGVEGDADTAVPWRYVAYQVRGHVVNQTGGDIYVGGTSKTSLSYAEGYNVPVYYRARGGYKLVNLKVDATELPVDGNEGMNEYYVQFDNLQADHDVYVTYETFFGSEVSHPSTNVYDGVARVIDVDLIDWDWNTESSEYTEIRYAISPESDVWMTEEEYIAYYSRGGEGASEGMMNVGDHEVYYRVYAKQPGYGTTFDEPGWVWVDTGVSGHNTVTVTPRPLVITANSFKIEGDYAEAHSQAIEGGGYLYTGDYQGVTVRAGDLIGGDTVDLTKLAALTCPDFEPRLGQYEIELHNAATTADADHDHDDVTGTGNYVVYLNPGALSVIKTPLEIGGVKQYGGLDPEDPTVDTGVDRVEEIYSGESWGLTVTINSPNADKDLGGFRTLYSTDDGQTWSTENPTFYHAGTNKVWYAVESADTYANSTYFWVTNYSYVIVHPREITVTVDSDTKQYDGTALTDDGWAITSGELATGDALDLDVIGSQTNVGTSGNEAENLVVKSANGAGEVRTGDYEITVVDGTLTVTPAHIYINNVEHDPDNPPLYGETGIDEVVKYYDGVPTNLTVNVTAPTDGYTIQYSTDGGKTWQNENPQYTEAGSYTVYVKVSAPNYEDAITYSRVLIKPRPLTVTVQDAQMQKGDTSLPAFSAVVTDDLKSAEQGHKVVVDPSVASSLAYTIGVGCDHKNLAPENLPVTEDGQGHELEATGETIQGNYTITYVPGKLVVTDKKTIPYDVESPNIIYGGTNICITVTPGDTAPEGTVVKYGNSPDNLIYDTREQAIEALGLDEVSESGTLVYFSVTTSDPGYVGVTNSAPVYIRPRPVTVTADDKQKEEGAQDPAFTATVTGLIEGESADLISYTLSREPGEEINVDYPITSSGATRQGNYTVSYLPGTLTIVNTCVNSLWIVDHAEEGDNTFYLAVEVTRARNQEVTAEFARDLDAAGRLQVVYAATEAELAAAEPQVVHLRDPSGDLDVDRSWIWVTVKLKPYQEARWLRWKVIITHP